jgi:hypothetical protein
LNGCGSRRGSRLTGGVLCFLLLVTNGFFAGVPKDRWWSLLIPLSQIKMMLLRSIFSSFLVLRIEHLGLSLSSFSILMCMILTASSETW